MDKAQTIPTANVTIPAIAINAFQSFTTAYPANIIAPANNSNDADTFNRVDEPSFTPSFIFLPAIFENTQVVNLINNITGTIATLAAM